MRQSILTEPPRSSAVRAGNIAACPKCGKRLCDLSPGASASGVTLWCRCCKTSVALELRGAPAFS